MILGLILGFTTSLHCVGMCGPLHLALPLKKGVNTNIIALHLGRIFTYMILGVFAGIIGEVFRATGIHNWVAIISGVIIIAAVLIEGIPYFKSDLISSWLKKSLSQLFKKSTTWRFFVFGLANGLLPCGMVYFALLTATSYGDTGAIVFMGLFGLGTVSLLVITSTLGSFFKEHFLIKQKYVLIALGCLLIVRGSSLGIPYLSPSEEKSCCHKAQTEETSSCCEKKYKD